MNGRPFRIAAAGLGAALVASIVAGFSHFRTESRLLARSEKISVPLSTIAAATPPPLPDLNARDVVEQSLPSTRRPSTQRPTANVVSNIRRKKEFVELPPPPEFLDEPEPHVQLAVAPPPVRSSDSGDPRLLAEIAMLRKDVERLNDQQRLEREIERDRHARELASVAREHRLSELKSSIDELKSIQHDRRVAMLQTEPPMPVLERPAAPPVAVESTEPAPATPKGDRSVQVLESPTPDHFEFRFEETSLQSALAEVGRRGSMNLVISPEVDGVVTASWKNVTPQEALEALKLAHHLSVDPQGTFILVSTSKEAHGRAEHSKNTLVQIFRPLYISG